jgi:hypothetical protein
MLNIGDRLENGQYRIHRYASAIRIVALDNAGKRGKKCAELAVYNLDGHCGYKVADGAAEEIAEAAAAGKPLDEIAALAAGLGAAIERNDLRGVDVAPGGFKRIEIHVPDKCWIEAGHDDFCIRDLADRNNDPAAIPPMDGKKKAVKAFYALAADLEKAGAAPEYGQVLRLMRERGIDYHSYCMLD